MSKLFGGKNPFDDPFFAQPFGGFFGANPFDRPFFAHPFDDSSRRQITIEEIDTDGDDIKTSGPGKEIIVDNSVKDTHGIERSFMYQKVAYGGPEGIYYTCSEGMLNGGDGVFLAEMKEEDKTIGESLHTVSKGLRNKGHSMTTKNNSEGEKNLMQTLHNLDEDELSSFEEDWKSNAEKYLPGWNNGSSILDTPGDNQLGWKEFPQLGMDGFPQLGWNGYSSWSDWGGWALPSSADYGDASGKADEERPKKVVSVNID